MSQIYHDGEEKPWSISALPDFAQIYSFLQCFGHLLYLPRITLGELEEFFLRGYTSLEDPVVLVHWRLLNNVCKKVGRGEWQRAAIKFGRRHSLWRESVPYGELSIRQRMRLLRCQWKRVERKKKSALIESDLCLSCDFKLTCEEQFDLNGSFKERMKKELLPTSLQSEPFGVDRDGQRHWLLKDSVFDLRLFGESEYDTVYSPERATWVELARSVDDLSIYIAKLESRWPSERSGKGPSSCRSDETSLLGLPLCAEYPLKNVYEDVGCEEEGGRVSHTSTGKEKEETGCLKCKKDTNYKQLLLCDGCDRECHTYCQYPILWNIPNGKWYCPLCKEKRLLLSLKQMYSHLSSARFQYQKTVERKQRSVARLQRGGLLLQNILVGDEDEDSGARRSRRTRKELDYAKLNDFYLPPLGPTDIVGSTSTESKNDITLNNHNHIPYGTRSSRRLRGVGTVETVGGQSPRGDDDDDMEGGQFPGGDMEGGQFPGGDMEGGQFPDDDMEGGQFPGGDMEGGQFPDDDMEGGHSPDDDMEGGHSPDDDIEGGQSPRGADDNMYVDRSESQPSRSAGVDIEQERMILLGTYSDDSSECGIGDVDECNDVCGWSSDHLGGDIRPNVDCPLNSAGSKELPVQHLHELNITATTSLPTNPAIL